MTRRTATSSSTGRSGRAATARPSSTRADCKIIAIDRDPEAFRLSRALVEAYPGRLVAARAAISEMARSPPSEALRRRRRRGARSRRLLDAARSGRARLLLRQGRPARHAHGRARADRGRHRQRRSASSELAEIIFVLARSGAPAPSPRRSSTACRGADRAHGRTRRHRRRVLGRKRDETKHPATRTFQALAPLSQRELDELARGLSAAERLLKARRPARRRHLPFARGPHRQAVFCQPQRPAATRLAPSARGRRRNSRAKLPAS